MSEDYYKTLIKDIIENNEKEKAIKIIANKLNKKQISNEKEILANIEKTIEIERLNKEVEKYKKRCYEALMLIRKNYGLLDKYGIDMLDDILNGK